MFTELETTRFFLKQIVPEDQGFIFKGLSDPQVIPFYGVQYKTFEETKGQMEFYERIRNEATGCHWKIVDKISAEPAGVCGFNGYQAQHEKAEIGYWLLPEYWKKGIMQKVLPVMIHHIFSTWKMHRLESVIEEGNEASCRLAEKLGFTYEGMLRESEIKNGKRISLLMYSLLSTDPVKYDSLSLV
ncbi:MAG: GNAT family N-acetyltransferase [Chitinophagaceae bacterium]|nr:GNAT family N-acetyltransferase [Chitinophagaceae bacterium]